MAIYDKNGNQLYACYDKNGISLPQAYDEDGNIIFTADESGLNLRVMQYNVGQWYKGAGGRVPEEYFDAYSAVQRAIITDNSPDIACFEEYVDPVLDDYYVSDMIGDVLPYSVNRGGESVNYHSKAIYSKTSLTDMQYQSLEWGTLIHTTTTIDGVTINIICTHWSNTQEVRARESATVLAYVAELENVIVCGDVNCACMDKEHIDYTSIVEAWIDAGYHTANYSDRFGFFNTWFAGNNFDCVDYASRGAPNDTIFTSPNIYINNVWRDEHKISVCEALGTRHDHAPLVADVTIFDE